VDQDTLDFPNSHSPARPGGGLEPKTVPLSVTIDLMLTSAQVVHANQLTLTLSSAAPWRTSWAAMQMTRSNGNIRRTPLTGARRRQRSTAGEKDTLFGNEDNDYLAGGVNIDQLFGGAGHDLLRGGAGNRSAVRPVPEWTAVWWRRG